MKAGVSKSPWGVETVPSRALQEREREWSVNWRGVWGKRGFYGAAGARLSAGKNADHHREKTKRRIL
jgi:hypothetical protein